MPTRTPPPTRKVLQIHMTLPVATRNLMIQRVAVLMSNSERIEERRRLESNAFSKTARTAAYFEEIGRSFAVMNQGIGAARESSERGTTRRRPLHQDAKGVLVFICQPSAGRFHRAVC